MQSKYKNVEYMCFDNAIDIVDKIFRTLLSRCQNDLEKSMIESDFILLMFIIFWGLNCIHSFRIEKKIKFSENI